MNTGKIIETSRLYLIPGKNSRDDEAFIKMLRQDGNFREFTGLEFKEKYLEEFRNYFERKGNCECIYSIYRKNKKDFIGYVGFHKEIMSYCTSTYVLKKENYNNEILYF